MKKQIKGASLIPQTKNAAPPAMQGQGPTIDQLVAEGHGRIRRMNSDQVYIGSLIDTLHAEIAAREKQNQELRVRFSKYETKATAGVD